VKLRTTIRAACYAASGVFHIEDRTNWKDDNFCKVVLNALVWLCKLDVPADGVKSSVSEEEITANWDDKRKK
jgi:hypothetical protein